MIEEQALVDCNKTPDESPATNDTIKCLYANESGDALIFKTVNEDRFIYDHSASQWSVWRGHYWQDDVRNESMDDGIEAVIDVYEKEAMRLAWCATKAQKSGQSDEAKGFESLRKKVMDRIKFLNSVQRRRNVLTLSAAGAGLVGHEWDCLSMVVACPNGVVDLRTGDIRPGQTDDYLKTACPTEYQGIDAPCTAWDRFLSDVFERDQDLIDYIQRLFGYGLTGTSALHILPFFYGDGRNGKGTFLETIKHVVGDYAFKAESELLLEQRQAKASGSPNSAVLSLRGKRFVWCSETDEGRKLNTARVKELVGGDTLNARAVYGRRHVEFRPSHLLLLMTNNKPQAPAGDFALWQRIHLIPFTQSFVSEPKATNEHKADPFLSDKLKAEAPGILAWMVRGCLLFQQCGLNPPEKVKAATAAYQRDEDIIGHFFDDACFLGPGSEVRAGQLYKAYQAWCLENGHRPLSGTKFGREMKTRFDSYQNHRGIFYIGVGVIQDKT